MQARKSNQKIIIITAPSGAGKTSITRYLIEKLPVLAFSISAATRPPRGAEKDGVDYHFMNVETFHNKIKENAFVEWEMVYEGKYYGTLRTELERIWNEGRVPVLDIDVHGAVHVQEEFSENALSVFIEPPSLDALKKRLESRGTETVENVQTRIGKASYEISFKHHFNQIIVNDDLQKACLETEQHIKNFLGIQTDSKL